MPVPRAVSPAEERLGALDRADDRATPGVVEPVGCRRRRLCWRAINDLLHSVAAQDSTRFGVVMSRANSSKREHPPCGSSSAMDRLAFVVATCGLRKTEIAARLEMAPQQFSDVLHGRRPVSISAAERIAHAFGVSPGWLLFGEEPVGVGESNRGYGSPGAASLPLVGGGRKVLPADLHMYKVEGGELAPVASAGQTVLVVRAATGEKGPAVVTLARRRWRIIGVLF